MIVILIDNCSDISIQFTLRGIDRCLLRYGCRRGRVATAIDSALVCLILCSCCSRKHTQWINKLLNFRLLLLIIISVRAGEQYCVHTHIHSLIILLFIFYIHAALRGTHEKRAREEKTQRTRLCVIVCYLCLASIMLSFSSIFTIIFSFLFRFVCLARVRWDWCAGASIDLPAMVGYEWTLLAYNS